MSRRKELLIGVILLLGVVYLFGGPLVNQYAYADSSWSPHISCGTDCYYYYIEYEAFSEGTSSTPQKVYYIVVESQGTPNPGAVVFPEQSGTGLLSSGSQVLEPMQASSPDESGTVVAELKSYWEENMELLSVVLIVGAGLFILVFTRMRGGA